jgi:glycerol kinase
VAGAAVQWLRDELGIIRHASEIEEAAVTVNDSAGVYVVPAFTGLGAPYWDPHARGAILGLTRGSGRAHICRATLESIAFQCRDVLDAMSKDAGDPLKEIRVDGGASENNFLMQFQADILGIPVIRPACIETTALGAAYLAGLAVGFWDSQEEIEALWAKDRAFYPDMQTSRREELYAGWQEAVKRVR